MWLQLLYDKKTLIVSPTCRICDIGLQTNGHIKVKTTFIEEASWFMGISLIIMSQYVLEASLLTELIFQYVSVFLIKRDYSN